MPSRPWVDAQDLAQHRAKVLGVPARAVRVADPAAVARADVEHPVRTEGELSSVVVLVVVGHPQHEPTGSQGGLVRSASPKLDHPLIADTVREVHVEQPRLGVVGREGHRQQTLLVRGPHTASDVEERPPLHLAVVDHANPSVPLDDHHTSGVPRRPGHMHRQPERANTDQAHTAAGLLRGPVERSRRICGGRPRHSGAIEAYEHSRQDEEDDAQASYCHARIRISRPPITGGVEPTGLQEASRCPYRLESRFRYVIAAVS